MNKEIELFYSKEEKWKEEYNYLRNLVLDCGLVEELKWGVPCYTHNKANILIVHGFKNYCALNFFKGALLSNENGLLIQPTENSQSARQIRFVNVDEIIKNEKEIKRYIFESIEVEKLGMKVDYKKNEDYQIPEELLLKFSQDKKYKEAFESLTPGRQRGYYLYFAEAKQSSTRQQRIEKVAFRILRGKGLGDCVCGFSRRMPNCDGSHNKVKQ